MNRKIAVIAAHPDDEILGCGGTSARHITLGHQVSTLIVAEGVVSRYADGRVEKMREQLAQLKRAAVAANGRLGVSEVTFLGMPDNRLDKMDRLDLIREIEKFIARMQPDTIYTHHGADLNIDHRRVFEAVLTAARPQPGVSVKRLLSFEVPSSTEWQSPALGQSFVPNWFVDISQFLEQKMTAVDVYQEEMRPWPHARSAAAIRHLAGWRGASCGCDAAEAFMLVRNIDERVELQ